jgi:hypothetical protein
VQSADSAQNVSIRLPRLPHNSMPPTNRQRQYEDIGRNLVAA